MGTTTTNRSALTIQDIEAGYANPDWLGWGYLGERQRAFDTSDPEAIIDPATIHAADEAALAVANAKRWTSARFFTWMNSKNGRWYADSTLGSDDDPATAAASLVR